MDTIAPMSTPLPQEGDLWLVCGEWGRYRKLEEAGIPCIHLDDLLSSIDCQCIDAQASRIAKSWFRVEGEDVSELAGVSLGAILEPWIHEQPVLPCLKLIAALNKHMESASGVRRLIVVDQLEDEQLQLLSSATENNNSISVVYYARALLHSQAAALRMFGESYTLDVLILPLPVFDAFGGRFDFASLPPARSLQQRILIALYSLLAFVVRTWRGRGSTSHKPRVAISSYNVTQRVMLHWLRDKNSVFDIVLFASGGPPRPLLLQLLLRGVPLLYPKTVTAPHKLRAVRKLQQRWRHAEDKADYHGMCHVGPVGLDAVFTSYFKGIVDHQFPRLAAYLIGVRQELHRLHISGVVVPYDTPVAERCLVSTANAQKILTLGVQNGHMDLAMVPENFLSARLAVFNSSIRAAYGGVGRLVSSMEITGCAYFDDHQLHRKPSAPKARGSQLRVLLLTAVRCRSSSFHEEERVERYIDTTLRAMYQASRDFDVTVKLHPSEDLSVYESFVRNPGFSNFKIVSGPIMEYLLVADLVIGTDSTALYEALLYRIPVIVVNPNKREYSFPFDGTTVIPVAHSGEELGAILQRNFQNFHPLCTMLSEQDLAFTTGPSDGKNTLRLYNYIKGSLASG